MGRLSKLAKYLNQHIVGNVFDRPSICEAYAKDRSILQATPRLVAFPESTDDLRKLVRFANQLAVRDYELPITIRGSGIDKTGAAIGDGLLISTERMNHIEEIDLRGRLVRVQPGLTLGALNSALGLQGLCLPVDYDPRATIGGLIANCPTDDAQNRHGGIFHFVERAEVVLASGDVVQLAPYNLRIIELKKQQTSFEGSLYRRLDQILDQHADTIVDRSMRPFDAAGYANVTRVKNGHSLNLLPLLFASQGTLGLVSDVILRMEVLPSPMQRLLTSFQDEKVMVNFLNLVTELEPALLKVYDLRIIAQAAEHGNQPELLNNHRLDQGWIVLIGFDDRRRRAGRKLQRCLEALPPGSFNIAETPQNTDDFRELSSALLSFLNDTQVGERTPILDDVFIPSYRLADFLAGLRMIEETLGLDLPVFGSFSTANYNVRPEIDCSSLVGRRQIVAFLRQYSRLVADCEGSLTGGSPEGRVKHLPTIQTFSPAELELYADIKAAFDPNNILNPEVKLGAELKNTIRHLRTEEVSGVITP